MLTVATPTSQIEARAFQIWGGSEGLEEEQHKRTEAREKRQKTKYVKTIKGIMYEEVPVM